MIMNLMKYEPSKEYEFRGSVWKGVSKVLCKHFFSTSYHRVPSAVPYVRPSTIGCVRAPSLVSCARSISGKTAAPVGIAA